MSEIDKYIKQRKKRVSKNAFDVELGKAIMEFTPHLIRTNFVKNFTWMGVPILQYPTDMMVMQELIYDVKPDLVIETGTAFGGSALFYASILVNIDPQASVISIDIDHRSHTRKVVNDSYLEPRIALIQSDSTNPKIKPIIEAILNMIAIQRDRKPRVIVCLDSNHTADHVFKEMELYAKFVQVGGYMVVFDTAIEYFMKEQPKDRPWGPGNNPMIAVHEYMRKYPNQFVMDANLESRAVITGAPGGWLRRIAR